MSRAYVYIDGFNFYYGAVKGTLYKWLDFKALFTRILPSRYDVKAIKYFTAHVRALPPDLRQPIRQQTFLAALKAHVPEIEIILGQFRSHPKTLPLATPRAPHTHATVIKTEEKGSDVNLAVHMVNDAWLDLYDCAVVVSNDSDLAEALRIVKDGRRKEVILLTPPKFKNMRVKELKDNATICRTIKQADLAASQLPDPIPGNTTIRKPSTW